MKLVCPRCGSKVRELIECENCGNIGCIRCVRKKYGKWICFKCKEPEKKYYYQEESKEEGMSNALNAMFG